MAGRLEALNSHHSIEFVGNKKPKCPHCGSDFDIEDNEAWHLYDDSNTHDVECDRCGEDFQVSSIADWRFSTDEQEDE
jgi:DNA-directed RNA polymerase subunit RPC12/RpoP